MQSRLTLTIAILTLLAGIAAFFYFLRRAPVDRPPNVVLVTVDTLRPDRLGFGGHDRRTSPVLDALAGESVVFPNTYSVSGWTLPSVATILTGHYPRDHGATDFHWALDAAVPTLASTLALNGYDTRAFVSHLLLTPNFGVAQGFETYDHTVLEIGHPHDVSTGEQLTDLAIRATRDMQEPYFLWVHYFDPHFEYLTHDRWREFGGDDIDRYDQEIAFTDAHIARLLDHLRGRGLDDRTVLVFTSDHGEEFGEHGDRFHYTLFEEVMRCPMFIKAPGLAPGTNPTVAQQIDIVPTILALTGVPGRGELPGRNLLGPAAADRPVFMERDRPPPYNQRGVINGRYKLVVIEEVDPESIPRTSQGTEKPIVNVFPGMYMYDLEADPGETTNIYDESDPRAIEMLVMLAEHFSVKHTPAHEVEIDETLRDKLRSLGYIR